MPGRPAQRGRNQLVLDMGRKDVREYLYTSIANNRGWLASYTLVGYEQVSNGSLLQRISHSRQGETSHRFMMGTYDLLNRIVNKFPNVSRDVFGGGHLDPGMLYFSPQICK